MSNLEYWEYASKSELVLPETDVCNIQFSGIAEQTTCCRAATSCKQHCI